MRGLWGNLIIFFFIFFLVSMQKMENQLRSEVGFAYLVNILLQSGEIWTGLVLFWILLLNIPRGHVNFCDSPCFFYYYFLFFWVFSSLFSQVGAGRALWNQACNRATSQNFVSKRGKFLRDQTLSIQRRRRIRKEHYWTKKIKGFNNLLFH